jgi:hypothetical protein
LALISIRAWKVALPSGLLSLTFGYLFDQSMKKVALPIGLQSMVFGGLFNQEQGEGGSTQRFAELSE